MIGNRNGNTIGKESKAKNRWICTTSTEINIFKKTMILISLTSLLALILLYFFSFIFHFFYSGLLTIISRDDVEFAVKMFDILFTEELLLMAENIASILISAFTFTLSCLFLMLTMNGNGKYIDSYVSLKPSLPKNSFILIIVGLSVVNFFSYVSSMLDGVLTYIGIFKYESVFYSFPQTAGGIIIYFLSIVVTPALFEEFAFRYLMLNALRRYGNVFAIVVSSVLFGFLHASTSAFFFATALGVFSAYMAIKTKSLWFSIILHAAVNSVSMAFEYLSGIFLEDTVNIMYFIYFEVILLISAIYMIAFLKKNKKIELPEHKSHIYIEKRTKALGFLNIASVVFFVAVIFISLLEYYQYSSAI